MVKKAKKLLAVILSAILILSVVPLSVFTAAAESVTGYISAPLLSLGVTTNVSYDGTETSGAFRFCPDSSGVYILNSKGYLDTYVRVLDESGNQIGYNDDGGQNSNFQLDLNLESGKSYYLLTRLCNASSSGNYEIIITETPVERIEVEDISVIEGTSGYYSGYWDDSEYVEYWRYYSPNPAFTIYFKDKTSKTVGRDNGINIDGNWYYLSTTDNQSYDNQWTVGNSYKVNCTFMGVSSSFNVNITENPVERIEVEDVSIMEGTSGYYNSGWNGSEFVEYWYYSWFYPSFTVHFKDKTSKTVERGNSGTEIDGTWYSLNRSDNQSYDNQWTVGNSYKVNCTFMGVSSSFNVTIKPYCAHSNTEIRNARFATCAQAGYEGDKYCADCGELLKYGKTISAKSHVSGDWVIDRRPTFTQTGSRHKNCLFCGIVTETEEIPRIDRSKPLIMVKSEMAQSGESVDVKISLKNNPGITSAKLKVSYPESLQLQNITFGNDLGGEAIYSDADKSAVILNWFNGLSDLKTKDILFATLTFNISGSFDLLPEDVCVSFEPDDICNVKERNVKFEVVSVGSDFVEHIAGDINGDNKVNNKDLVRLFQYLSGYNVTVNKPALDVNGDGSVNNKDITHLFKYLSGWDVQIS